MTKQTILFSILFGLTTLLALNIHAKTESLSLANIKSSEEIFYQHIQKVDEMNPDNGQQIKKLLDLSFKAANIRVTEYIRLILSNKHTAAQCGHKALVKSNIFCVSHRIKQLYCSLTVHDIDIAHIVYPDIISKYTAQHHILKDIAPDYLSYFCH